jgi:hypothetical protein
LSGPGRRGRGRATTRSRGRIAAITRRLLDDEAFCRDVDRRVEAAAFLVESLPRSAASIELLLRSTRHRQSHEVRFTILNCLDCWSIAPSHVRRLLPTVRTLLFTIDSEVAFVWMVLGCMLGDGWHRAKSGGLRDELEALLCNAARNAPYVSGREGALHGIEHALGDVSFARGKELLELVRVAALEDRSASVRTRARMMLEGKLWWGGRSAALLRHARKLARSSSGTTSARRRSRPASRSR